MKTIFQDPGNFHVNTGGKWEGVLWGPSDLEEVRGAVPLAGGSAMAFPLLTLPRGLRVIAGGLGQLNCAAPPHAAEVGSHLVRGTLAISPHQILTTREGRRAPLLPQPFSLTLVEQTPSRPSGLSLNLCLSCKMCQRLPPNRNQIR